MKSSLLFKPFNNWIVTVCFAVLSMLLIPAQGFAVGGPPPFTAGGPDNCISAYPYAVTLTGASLGTSATTGAWSITSGGGTLSSTAQTTSPQTVTYKPAANYSGTVILTLTTNGTPVSGTRTLTVKPTAPYITGSIRCNNQGDIGTITSSVTVSGISYQLYNLNMITFATTPVQAARIGNGTAFTWSNLVAGTYIVIATNSSISCVSQWSNNADCVTGPPSTITTDGTAAAVCYSASGQTTTLAYSATTNSPTSYSINWDAAANTAGLADQGYTAFAFNAGGGSLTGIVITAGTAAGGPYSGTMTIWNYYGCATTQAVTVTVALPTTANAGADQTGAATCGLTSVTLAGNTPTVGTGAWSIQSGAGGNVTTPASPTSTFTGTAGVAYTLRWTISNCTASTDDVLVTFNQAPTAAAAGADQTGAATCGLTTVTLAANTPTVGTGAWSITAGAGGTVTTPTSPTSTFSGTAGVAYTLRWTISNAPCTASTDEVLVTFNQAPTTANAGADQTSAATCGLTTVTLAANTPTVGTGAWSITAGAGGTVTTPTSPTSTFSGTAGVAYTLRWTISNAPCTASTDDVLVTFNQAPTVAAAGTDQTSAATCGLTTVTLAANTPTVGTGAWSITAGAGGTVTTPTSPTSTFTGTAGNSYTLRWTISNAPCTASTDEVNVTFNKAPTAAAAGTDQTSAATCGLTTVTLAANTPTVGTGAWTITNGAGGSFADATSPTSTFSGTAGNSYTLRWTISNAPCTASTDDVLVTFNKTPTTAAAGADQTSATTCGLTTVTLAANTPTVGTGAWSITAGAGGTVTTPTSPTSTFTGTAGTAYTLRWTISNAPCTASTDDVNITFNQNPTTAAAGPDQTSSATCGLTTVTLAANTPTVGTGAWTITNGAGGSFADATSPTSTFSGTAGNSYTLRWTISNAPCTASTDEVNVTFNQAPSAPGVGTITQPTCLTATGSVVLSGLPAGNWIINPGTITGSTASTTLSGLTASTTYNYTVTNAAGCTSAASANVVIDAQPVTDRKSVV